MSENKKNDTPKKPDTSAVKKDKKKGEKLKNRITKFIREYLGEMKKISWPTFSEVVKNSLVTLAVVAIVGVFIWAIDFGANQVRTYVIGLAEDNAVTSGGQEDIDIDQLIQDQLSGTNLEVVTDADIAKAIDDGLASDAAAQAAE
jgi:preprotein translocase subunit SecE